MINVKRNLTMTFEYLNPNEFEFHVEDYSSNVEVAKGLGIHNVDTIRFKSVTIHKISSIYHNDYNFIMKHTRRMLMGFFRSSEYHLHFRNTHINKLKQKKQKLAEKEADIKQQIEDLEFTPY